MIEKQLYRISLTLILTLCSLLGMAQVSNIPNGSIITRWTKLLRTDSILHEYPRPNLVRKEWTNLNGLWGFIITDSTVKYPKKITGKILVPFPIESALSGVGKSLSPSQRLWYKKKIYIAKINTDKKCILHFGAVDWEATVFVNKVEIGKHRGGYTAFNFDITSYLRSGENEIMVKVYDPTEQGIGPHGKQTSKPENIYYTSSSGIWQTVWLEIVPKEYIRSLKITPNVDKGEVTVKVRGGTGPITIQIYNKGEKIAHAFLPNTISDKRFESLVTLKIPNAELWNPDSPFLYDLKVKLGEDSVASYFGMRKIEIKKDEKGFERIFLNNKYTYNLGTLDQGYWPDGLYTSPNDDALVFDIKAIKAMGFNTIRKHIKVEPSRWYYHADKIGILVWQDLVNPGSDSREGRAQFEKESTEIIEQFYNYPCITTWVLFNEKWGQYDQKRLTNWIKKVDPTRLVNGHSGEMLYVNDQLRSESPDAWVDADLTDVHAYPMPGHIKYQKGKAAVIGEFGGIGVPIENHLWNDLVAGWGYDGVVTTKELKEQYNQMVDSLIVLEKEGLTASIYTQPFDIESEQNGLITYDREIVKLPISEIRKINSNLWSFKDPIETPIQLGLADSIILNYSNRLKQYDNGRRDSAFLRSLAITARQKNDTLIAKLASADYLKIITHPSQPVNIKFIQAFTKTTSDFGFKFLFKNVQTVDKVLGQQAGSYGLILKIGDEINAQVQETMNLSSWLMIEQKISKKYGKLGEEALRQYQVLYAINNEDWKLFANVGKIWFRKYGCRREWITPVVINKIAWPLFEKSDNVIALKTALEMTTKALGVERNSYIIDTHANLLYKLNRHKEAIYLQEQAVKDSPDHKEIAVNLEKMRRGEPTWPQDKP